MPPRAKPAFVETLSMATAFTSPLTQARPGLLWACATHALSDALPWIPKIQTSFMWLRLDTPLGRMLNAEFFAQPMAAKPGAKSCTRMKTQAALISRSILQIPTLFSRHYGRRGARPGAWIAAARAAVCIAALTAEQHGSISLATACRMESWAALALPWLTTATAYGR